MSVGAHPAWQNWRNRRSAEAPPAEHTSWMPALSVVPICGALALHWILVLINTHVTTVSDLYVIGGEGMLMIMALGLIGAKVRAPFIALVFVMLAYFALIWLIRGDPDPKTVRDMIIPVTFYELGRQRGTIKVADRLMIWSCLFITIVAVIEMTWPDQYSEKFNVLQYYIARGELPEEASAFFGTAFSVNGQRPEGIGRSLMPILGPHRASSIFIEPVSLGNYAVFAAAWFLIRPPSWRLRLPLLILPIMLVVLADSRFGAYMLVAIGLIWLCRKMPLAKFAAPALPIVVLTGLALIYLMPNENMTRGDDLLGRLYYSGRYLYRMTMESWLGLVPVGRYAFDSGYADILRNGGVIGVAAAWVLLTAAFQRKEQSFFKMFIMAYYSMILCISASVFSIKTAAALWFVFGCLGAFGISQETASDDAPAPETSGPRWRNFTRRAPRPDDASSVVR